MTTLPGARRWRLSPNARDRAVSSSVSPTRGRSWRAMIRPGQLAELGAVGLDDEVDAGGSGRPGVAVAGRLGDRDQSAAGAQHPPGPGHGLTADRIDDDVDVADLILEPGGVIDDPARAEAGDEVGVAGGGGGGHHRAVAGGELDRVAAHRAGAAVDEHMLAGLQVAWVCRACQAVSAASGTAAVSAWLRVDGLAASSAARAVTYSAAAPGRSKPISA